MSSYLRIGAGLLALTPMLALGVSWDSEAYFTGIASTISRVIATLLPAFIGLVIIGFAYGLFIYVKGGAKEQEEGKKIMIWGTLAVVILLSIYGLAGLFQNIFGASGGDESINPPTSLTGLDSI
jgi:hypothetical protein